MELLADESIDMPIVAWLRQEGHDVVAIAEIKPGQADAEVLESAHAQHRVLLTRDLDFGELVFSQGRTSAGVILLRLPGPTVQQRLASFQRLWRAVEAKARDHFVVVTRGKIRARPL